jgi:RNA polymerase sigma-70 factor (ECF subfamily)
VHKVFTITASNKIESNLCCERKSYAAEERGLLAYNFELIVKTHQERVRNTVYSLVKNQQDADDLAQEVFIQVYASMPQFRRDAELSTWIYRIAVNKALDFLRKKKRKKRLAQLVSLFGFGEDQEEVVPGTENDPHQNVEDLQRREVLQSALEQLPENQKTAIVLSKYQGFSNREISDIMGLSVSAVESLIHRAKNNLHKLLYDYYEKHI